MKAALKSAVVVLPLLAVFFGMRACSGGAAGRWQTRIEAYDPGVQIIEDTDDLIVIAADVELGGMVGKRAGRFRKALIENYGDLVGHGRDQRMVVVLFSTLKRLQEYAGSDDPFAPKGRAHHVYGFTRPDNNAVFFPAELEPDTMRHELVHLLMGETHGQTTDYSPWLGEGLAQIFETYDPDATPPTPPGLSEKTRRHVATSGLNAIDVVRLLRLQDYAVFTGPGVTRNYLDAYVLAAFLFERRPLHKLEQYVERERAFEKGREQEFHRIYKHKEPGFQRDLNRYLREIRESVGR